MPEGGGRFKNIGSGWGGGCEARKLCELKERVRQDLAVWGVLNGC